MFCTVVSYYCRANGSRRVLPTYKNQALPHLLTRYGAVNVTHLEQFLFFYVLLYYLHVAFTLVVMIGCWLYLKCKLVSQVLLLHAFTAHF